MDSDAIWSSADLLAVVRRSVATRKKLFKVQIKRSSSPSKLYCNILDIKVYAYQKLFLSRAIGFGLLLTKSNLRAVAKIITLAMEKEAVRN